MNNASRTMTADLALAIAASAWNVCGPQTGEAATPANVHTFHRASVGNALNSYASAPRDMYSASEIAAARAMLFPAI